MEETIFDESTQHVLDGGSLIQRIPWTYGASFSSICNLCAKFISSRYTNVTVVSMATQMGLLQRTVPISDELMEKGVQK